VYSLLLSLGKKFPEMLTTHSARVSRWTLQLVFQKYQADLQKYWESLLLASLRRRAQLGQPIQLPNPIPPPPPTVVKQFILSRPELILEALESHSEEWSPEEIFNYMSYIQPIISILIPILRAANIDIAGIGEEKLDELLEVSVLRIDDDKKREEAEQLLTMLKSYPITYRRFLWIVRQLLS